MSRKIKDALLQSTKALPAAGASASSDAFDLGVDPWPTVEQIQAKITAPAVASLADTKTLTYTFEDSADGSSFAAISELNTLVQTGAGGAGDGAEERVVSLPPSVRRYVRATAAVEAAGGDNTGESFTFELLF